MKIIKYLKFTFLVLLFYNCSAVKSVYDSKLTVDKNHRRSNYIIDKFEIKKDKAIIYFTSGFMDENVEVINGKDVIYTRKLNTIEQIGLAGSCIIENDKEVIITIDYKKQFKLNQQKLPKYKFIYIEKDKNHYTIEYTNKAKSFL